MQYPPVHQPSAQHTPRGAPAREASALASVGERLVFLGGVHRSGTTPLARWLAAHPQVSSLAGTGVPMDEGQHLQSVYPSAQIFGGLGRFGFAPAAHLTESSRLVTPNAAARLLQAWAPWWELSAARLLEKSPPNILRTRFLQALFPSSSHVILVRHPVAVAYATQRWSQTSIPELLRHWVICYRTFLDDSPYLHHVKLVRYEDLVRWPHGVLKDIWRFLGLKPAATIPDVRRHVNMHYYLQWREKSSAAANRAAVERYAGEAMLFGYSLLPPATHPPSSALVRALVRGRSR
jgi:Sulfotransferase family